MPLIDFQRLIRQLAPKSTNPTVEEYVQIDTMEETGETLNDSTIVNLVSKTTDEKDSDREIADQDPPHPDITLLEARTSLKTLISYFEQTTVDETSDNTLQTQWKLSEQVKEKSVKESKPKKLTNFFPSERQAIF